MSRPGTALSWFSRSSGPAVAITAPADGAKVSGPTTVTADASSPAGVSSVDFRLDGTSVHTDTNGDDGWGFPLDTTAVSEGTHQLSAAATDGHGATGSDAISVTVDNVADPVVVFVVDLDAHTHGKGMLWDAHAVVEAADSNANALPDAWVYGMFSGDGISPTPTSCQIDLTRCELHLDGLDKRAVSSVTFTVTDVKDLAGPYDATKNDDADGDSDGTTISISP